MEEYTRARDLDGLPFRCQTPFLEACREAGARRGSIVVDAPRLLARAGPHGIVDDRLFSDAHHPGLNAYVIMARDAVSQLKRRKAFGWPDSAPIPDFTMADCISHFKLGHDAWIGVCEAGRLFYERTANLTHDPSWRESVGARYRRAKKSLEAGRTPDETGIPSFRIREELRADGPPDGGVRDGSSRLGTGQGGDAPGT